MKLEEKQVKIAGIAFLAGFLLCYFLMGNASTPPTQKPLLTSSLTLRKSIISPQPTVIRFNEEIALPVHRSGSIKIYGRPIEAQPGDPMPHTRSMPNGDLIDLQYQPKVDLRDVLTPVP